MKIREVVNCRACKSDNLTKYLDLGKSPLANSLSTTISTSQKYDVSVLFCQECYLSQLSIVVDPKLMFTEYAYHASVSQTFKDHCLAMGRTLKQMISPEPHPLVMDIASNDGCLLDQFRLAGFERLMGVEPAKNLTTTYHDRKLIISNNYWSENLVDNWDHEKVSVLTATNVLAHVDNLDDFLKAAYKVLDPNGIFVVEVPYLYNLISGNQFDTIYHEHLSYFLLKPLKLIFEQHKIPIFRVEQYPIHGGSIRIYASKDAYPKEESVRDLLDFEESRGLYDIDTYLKFSERVFYMKTMLYTTIVNLLYHGNEIYGYGASAKGISLLNYCNLTSEHITCIVDDTPYKQGKLCPGSNIPIVDQSYFGNEPDYIFLLAWNFEEELRKKTSWHKGRYIIPIPSLRII